MKTLFNIAAVCICVCFTGYATAQKHNEEAWNKVKQAVKLEDDGNIDEAVKLLEEAAKIDPSDVAYPYELGYAYYLKKEYKTAEDYLEKCLKFKNVDDQVYQLLGNCYDNEGKSDKALKTYAKGLKTFPNSGKLYLETGVVMQLKKDYNAALASYEKGVEVDPLYPSNYYRAAKLFLENSDEKVWGMIYGELFMNLERNGKRTAEMSKLLYDTYKSQIKYTSDTSISISFSKMNTISITDITKLKLPYGTLVYEGATIVATATIKSINLNSLDTLRTNFVDFYFKKFNKDYPNVLFSYQNEIITAGHFEAYNHWLLMKGDEAAFDTWKAANAQKWDDFIKWYGANPIQLSAANRFYRAQYN